MENSEVTTQLKETLALQERLQESIEKSKEKDGWDKFAIVTSFISGVLIVLVGGAFTYFFQAQQTERQLAQQAEQKKLEEHRNRLLELNAVTNLLPFLTDPNENKQKMAYLALNTLASTKIVAKLAELNPSAGADAALSSIVASPRSRDQDRKVAELALLANVQAKAVIMLQAGKADEARALINKNLQAVEAALKRFPGDADVHALMGYTLKDIYQSSKNMLSPEERRAHLGLARSSFEKALQLDPRNASAHNGMGNVLFFEGKFDEAIQKHDRALELTNGNYPAAEHDKRLVIAVKNGEIPFDF